LFLEGSKKVNQIIKGKRYSEKKIKLHEDIVRRKLKRIVTETHAT